MKYDDVEELDLKHSAYPTEEANVATKKFWDYHAVPMSERTYNCFPGIAMYVSGKE